MSSELPAVLLNTDVDPDSSSMQIRLNASYADSVAEAGALPILAPPLDNDACIAKFAETADAFLFIGGRDYPPELYGAEPDPMIRPLPPRRSKFDVKLAKFAIASGKPILGICGGHQLLWIAMGGRLVQHVPNHSPSDDCEVFHEVAISEESKILGRIFPGKTLTVNSFHHQIADADSPGQPRNLLVSARSPEGFPEAFEGRYESYLLGVQWHPERMPQTHRTAIFKDFINAAKSSVLKRRDASHNFENRKDK